MIIACVDTETSTAGDEPNPALDEMCEFGMVVAHVETRTLISQISQIYKTTNWHEVAASIHKIPKVLCETHEDGHAVKKVGSIIDISKIDFIIAHNAEYDHGVIKRYWPELAQLKWICSKNDFTHKEVRITSRRLTHIAADYGIAIQGAAHRALADCLAVMEISFRNDIEEAWKKKNERKFILIAKGGYDKTLPPKFKENRWRWNNDDKVWEKEVPASELKEHVEFAKEINYKLTYDEIFSTY